FVLTAIDITNQKKADRERAQLEEQLRHAQRLESVGRLAGGVAHDFNNLLTVIFACCEFMAENLGTTDPLTTEVNDILEASTRGADLVRQLLAFGHKQILRPEIIEPNAIVDRTAKMLKRTIGEHITVSTQLSEQTHLVSVDPVQLTQVLMNLGVNARDAMPQGGELVFSSSAKRTSPGQQDRAKTESEFFRIEVSDTGCGMPPEVVEKIFEPFFSTKKPGEGTGLGLSVAHGIVAQSGGRISVDSTVSKGSRFIIDLPLRQHEEAPIQAEPHQRAETCQNGTVLVVDDDETIQKVVARSLRNRGYQVVQANNLEDALELGRRSKIEVLLTDVVMPTHSGPDVARALLEETPDMAVIFMSGHAHDLLGHHGVETGQVSFIQKPFLPDTLLRLIADVMKGETKAVGLPI
ncbi:response regulator, partial [Myxococcota bacterium]|nr:response regulator [Myxococcota bacterium]